MLKLVVPSTEYWDAEQELFFTKKESRLQLEHSLVSIAKWESKWGKPFLNSDNKTTEEIKDYIRCMTITQNVDPDIFDRLTNDNLNDINEYIQASMTATTFDEEKPKGVMRDVITSELIYYWMVSFNIPMECQKWHINRLLTLIRVCTVMNQPPEQLSEAELMARNTELNELRKKQFNTNG